MFFRRLARLLHPHRFFLPEELAAKPPVEEKLKLSDAILRGCGMVEETRRSFRGCAIGTGYMYKTRRSLAIHGGDDPCRTVARLFGMPSRIVEMASRLHYCGLPRTAVARWLSEQGY